MTWFLIQYKNNTLESQRHEHFMLSFAEAYDPLWEARMYKDGN